MPHQQPNGQRECPKSSHTTNQKSANDDDDGFIVEDTYSGGAKNKQTGADVIVRKNLDGTLDESVKPIDPRERRDNA